MQAEPGVTQGGAAHPGWEYLIAHHQPHRYNRTLSLTLGPRRYHICARCAGQIVGILAWMGLLWLSVETRSAFFDLRVQWAFPLLPIPAALDWVSQSTGGRESNNSLRVLSGALLGIAGVDLVAALLLGHWLVFGVGLLVTAGYIAVILWVLYATGALRRVVEEHFPGAIQGS